MKRLPHLLAIAALLLGACSGHRIDDTGAYLELLERPDRSDWQKPDELIAALELTGDEIVYDLGAGSGYFTFKLAKHVPEGGVIAVEVEPDFVNFINRKTFELAVVNATAILTELDDPGAGDEADLVFICNVLHHVDDWEEWVALLYQQMSPGARLAIVEFEMGDLPVGPDDRMKLPREEVVAELTEIGFKEPEDKGGFLPYQW
ncbi:MAG: class I SAM-dependent methyltransferase, partial [Deltaproteobacteria bacterium]|nr:class I SAM-dependent methyltransferase [Deltaproteobacteria bacterium]